MTYQEYWDAFLIGPFLFFAGLVGMGMVAMSLFRLRGVNIRYEPLSYVLLTSIVLALLFVMGDLSRPPTVMMVSMLNSFLELRYNLFLPILRGELVLRFSWMALGIVMLILALLAVAVWALPYITKRLRALTPSALSKPLIPLLDLLDKLANWLLARRWYYYVVIVIGVLVTLYSGFLISEAKAVPFWNTTLWGVPGIPTIWIFSASAGALALIRIYHLDKDDIVHVTEKYSLYAEAGEVAAIFLFLYNALNSASLAARESASALLWGDLAPIFWIFVIGLGIVTPLVATALSKLRHSPALIYWGSVAGLFGALALRTVVVYAGIPEPL
ncbi:MAG: NrfD/PsrC family molybdoenzyme membrane anchor subunit [Pyrobaculum sp.]